MTDLTERAVREAVPDLAAFVRRHGPIVINGTVAMPLNTRFWYWLSCQPPRRMKRVLGKLGVVGLVHVVECRLDRFVENWRYDPLTAAFYSRRRQDYAK